MSLRRLLESCGPLRPSLRQSLLAGGLAAAAAVGCEDTGGLSVVPVGGDGVRVVETNVDSGLLTEATIRVRFDRPLLPISALRQSLVVVTNDGLSIDPPVITYDPVVREVQVARPNPGGPWLTEGGYYRLVLGVAKSGEATGGVRAVDGSPLEATSKRLFAFRVASAPTPSEETSFCADVFPVLRTRCGGCHGGAAPTSGLDLSTVEGIRGTAVGVPARETAFGPTVGGSAPGSFVLAQDLPRIAAGDPSRSFLLYKMLLGEDDGTMVGCPSHPIPATARGLPLRPEERRLLADRIPGAAMPLQGTGATRDELIHLSRWIRAGASVPVQCQCP